MALRKPPGESDRGGRVAFFLVMSRSIISRDDIRLEGNNDLLNVDSAGRASIKYYIIKEMFCCGSALEAQRAGTSAAQNKHKRRSKQAARFYERDMRQLMRGGG
jgi:hypothetical protein